MLEIISKYPQKERIKGFLLILTFLFLLIPPLFALNFNGNTGFSIPIGNWATYHNSGPFISFGSDLLKKDFLTCGFSFDISSFSVKLNESYYLQIFSPGVGIKFYPLFFMKSYNLFLNSTLSYSFMEKRLHNSVEKGRDFSILTLIGAEFKVSDNWLISSFCGEKHFTGGIDMLILGVGLEFKK